VAPAVYPWLHTPFANEGEYGEAIPIDCPAVVDRITFPWDDRIWDTYGSQLRRTWNRLGRAGYKALTLDGRDARIKLVGISGQKASAAELSASCRRWFFVTPIIMVDNVLAVDFQRDPEEDPSCGGGDDDGFGEHQPESLVASIFDPEDAQSLAELGHPVAHTCGTPGGGDNPYGDDIVCWDEYLRLEISYDGGLSWSTLWEGWGRVCDLASEM
jgi:hypothetical protein